MGRVPMVLVVEDQAAIRRLLVRLLRNAGYRATAAGDGFEALQVLSHEAIDLVITDVNMPRISGPDLAAIIRAERPGLPVIGMSGDLDSEVVLDVFAHGMVAFIAKPVTQRSLIQTVQAALGATFTTPTAQPAPQQPVMRAPVAAPPVREQRAKPASLPSEARGEFANQLEEALERGDLELPAAAPILSRLLEYWDHPEAAASEIRTLVARSPALTAQVVRAANSPDYQRGHPATSVGDAIRRLGSRTVLGAAQTLLHQQFFSATSPAFSSLLADAWRASVFTATMVKDLASQRLTVDAEEAYLSALFHNVGEVLIMRFAATHFGNRPLTDADLRSIQVCCERVHQRLGGKLLKAWGFSARIHRAARGHHSLTLGSREAPFNARELEGIGLVRLASNAAAERGLLASVSVPFVPPDEPLLATLGVDAEYVAACAERTASVLTTD